jgi:SPP1 family holin
MKIKSDTIARTIILVVALLNQIAAVTGKLPIQIDESAVYQSVTLAVTLAASVIAWWKNNSFTAPAISADEQLKKLKEKGWG